MCLRCVLSRTCTILTNGFRHILWIGKSRVIRIDEASKRASSLSQFHHLRISIIRSFLMPFLQTLFYNPHTCDILQQANGTVYSSFVRNIIVSCLFIYNRTIRFNSHQRPCTRTQVSKVLVGSRYSRYGRSSIVSGYSNYRNRFYLKFFTQILGQHTDFSSRFYHIRKQGFADTQHFQQFFI